MPVVQTIRRRCPCRQCGWKRITRLPQHQRTLGSAKHVTLLGSPVGSEGGSCGEGGDRVGFVLPLSPSCSFREVRAKGLADARPLSVAKHLAGWCPTGACAGPCDEG